MTEYQNPNQDSGMERRLLLVFAITFIVLIASQPLIRKYAGKNEKPAQTTQQQQQQQTAQAPQTPAPAPGNIGAVPTGTGSPVVQKIAAGEQETVVDTPYYKITFSNKGGLVKSWVLKKYTDDKKQPLDLVNQNAARQIAYPLSLYTYDENLRNKLNSALYVVSQVQQGTTSTVTFEYADGDISARKSFSFEKESATGKPAAADYVVKAEVSVTRGGQQIAAFPAWPAGFGDETVGYSYAAASLDYQPTSGDKVIRHTADRKGQDIGQGRTVSGPFHWAGAEDQYFAVVFLPDSPQQSAMVQYRNTIDAPKDLNNPNSKETVKVEVLGAAVGNPTGPTSTRIFVGPKSTDVLDAIHSNGAYGQTSVGPNLGGLIDYGFFGVIAKPLFMWLKWTQAHWVSNWGWAIVILTVIINLALLPLRISSMKSALKMQKVQPQVNAIKKKYEKYSMRDPRRQEMNQEIAAVFKEHGANPAGGCLPMILQMPFLFAFYKMLGIAIELRHANWLWIKDLAAPDPYFVLPILIVVTTLLMQKMTPNPGMDPAQQKMMNLIMPLFLGWVSYKLAAGLGVYWVVGTVISIIQQQVMNHTELGREMKAEMEKRARKQKAKA